MKKLTWQSPEIVEIGNLRDLVKSGNAEGKSGVDVDGGSSGNDERMNKKK